MGREKILYQLDNVYSPSGCQSLRYSTDNGATWSKPDFFRTAGDYANQLMHTKDRVLAIPYDLFEVMVNARSEQRAQPSLRVYWKCRI